MNSLIKFCILISSMILVCGCKQQEETSNQTGIDTSKAKQYDSTRKSETNDCDTMYAVRYAASEKFDKLIGEDTFFVKSKDNYSLLPKELDVGYWTGSNWSMKRPNVDLYFAKIIGFCGSSIFYTSKETKWKNLHGGVALFPQSGQSYRGWLDITNFDDTKDFYMYSDSLGKQYIVSKNGKREFKVK